MRFSKAKVVFQDMDDEDARGRPPHNNVEIHDNGWVKVDAVDDDSGEDVEVYYPPTEIRRVVPETN